jgi:hypothetical protein
MCGTLRDVHIFECGLAKATWSQDVTGGFISLGIIHHVDVANSALGISLQRL